MPKNTTEQWSSTQSIDPEQSITIMPDYGMSPYAWLKPASDVTSYVGTNVGCYMCKPTQFPITDALHADFIAWCALFETRAEKPSFDWLEFHRQGVKLTTQLKGQVGSTFRVIYSKPFEDPDREICGVTEIW